ncbi:MAG: DUF4143 domain-containing protein [Tannerellaceae bacterium]|jgi:predicted AAA+ superfamily ATPase|nr:DUF4143 domain-containing protein [Tannerellaceae bacterium]
MISNSDYSTQTICSKRVSVVLNTLADDILMRDIAVRHNIRDVILLRQLTAYLITSTGNLVSASKLAGWEKVR